MAADSSWQDGGEPAAASLGQSDWVTEGGAAASSEAAGQSQWLSLSAPAGGVSAMPGAAQAAAGQSEWIGAVHDPGSGPAAAQSAWQSPGSAGRGQARVQRAPLRGSVTASADPYAGLGSIQETESSAGDLSIAGAAPGAAGAAGGALAQGQTMEDMIGQVMMVPMGLAAASGFMGQGFHTYGPRCGGGGFRTYGPGGGVIGGQVGNVINAEARTMTRYATYYAERAMWRSMLGGLRRR